MEPRALLSKLPGRPAQRGWGVWIAFTIVIAVILIAKVKPSHVTATYFPTAQTWWEAERDIYTPGITGYLYLPQSLYLFTPFLLLPEGPVREIAWRIFGIALFAFGLRRLLRRTTPEGSDWHFEVATLLVLLATGSSARNGQTNLHLAGLMLHACSDLIDRRWWRATLLLWGGMLAKPIGAVMILLVGALLAPMRGRLALGLGVFLLLPFLHPDFAYASEQYRLALEKLSRSSQPGAKAYDDFVGLARSLGFTLPQAARTAIAVCMALVTLGLAWLGLRRGGRIQGLWILTALAAAYLMLFNPRTETNSYVILVPWLAMLATYAWFDRRSRAAAAAFLLGCLALGCDNYGRAVLAFSRGLTKPLTALVFFVFLAWAVRRLRDHALLPVRGDGPADPA